MSEPARVLSVDCPWKFDDPLPGAGRGASKNYACMSVAELCHFPLPPIARDCVLFFWRVASMEREAAAVIRAWGFEPTGGSLTWVKTTAPCLAVIDPTTEPVLIHALDGMGLSKQQRWLLDELLGRLHFGMGRTVRNCDEVCVIARRGRPKIDGARVRSVFFAPMPRVPGQPGKIWHSAKPERFYDLVERMTEGPRVELFARKRRPGWIQYGNQLPDEGELPATALRR